MFKQVASAILAAAFVSALATSAHAQSFVATLKGSNEVPPVATTASGSATLTLNPNNSVTYSVMTTGLTGIAAHIHVGAAGVNGGIIVTLAGGPTNWAGTSGVLSAANLTALKTGGLYINVHTALNPGGEIRGQIQTLVSYFGNANVTVGQASAQLSGGALAVANIGSSGQDGVKIAVPNVDEGIQIEMQSLQLSGVGRSVSVGSTGSLNGVPGTFLGSAGFQNVGGVVQMTANYSAIGSTLVTVMVMKDGQFVGASSVPNGNLGTLNGTIPGNTPCGGLGKLGPFPVCIWVDWDDDVVVDPVGAGGPYIGNELLLLAANSLSTIDFLSEYEIKAAGVGSFTITCESGFPGSTYGVGCPGTGGHIPFLHTTGCPVVGHSINIDLHDGLPNSTAILFVGLTPSAIPLGGGCLLNAFPILLQINLPLGPTGAFSLPVLLPPSVGGLQLAMQALVIDPASPLGASASPGRLTSFEP